MTNPTFNRWTEYWKAILPGFLEKIERSRQLDTENYVESSLGIFAFVQEEFVAKATKNTAYLHQIFPMIIELQDILRATLVCQKNLVMATSALNLRTSFEIFANLLYITKNPTPEKFADRYLRFREIEKYLYDENSGSPQLTDSERAKIRESCSEWFTVKNGKHRVRTHWTGIEDFSLKKICKEIDEWEAAKATKPKRPLRMINSYKEVYGMASKFTHGSSIVVNMYRNQNGIGPIPNPIHPTRLNLMCTDISMRCFREACSHFGVNFPDHDYAVACVFFNNAEKKLREIEGKSSNFRW